MLDNKKFVKELSAIYVASNKAKQAAVSELAKIDEKYRKLAEEEKGKLKDVVKNLETQLKYYGELLNLNKDSEPVVSVEPEVEPESVAEEEGKIEDTIFQENNEDNASDEQAESETIDEKPASDDMNDIWPEPETEENEPVEEEKEDETEEAEEVTEEEEEAGEISDVDWTQEWK